MHSGFLSSFPFISKICFNEMFTWENILKMEEVDLKIDILRWQASEFFKDPHCASVIKKVRIALLAALKITLQSAFYCHDLKELSYQML